MVNDKGFKGSQIVQLGDEIRVQTRHRCQVQVLRVGQKNEEIHREESQNTCFRLTGLEVGGPVRVIVSDRVKSRVVDIGMVGIPLDMLRLLARGWEQNGLLLEARVLQPV